jgi:hypothetical protein
MFSESGEKKFTRARDLFSFGGKKGKKNENGHRMVMK